MKGIRNSHIGILTLAFTSFVAYSVVLGKQYYRAYCEQLGIPYYDVSLDAVSYSIVSPTLTVLAAGFIIWSIAYVFTIINWIPTNRKLSIMMGSVLLFLPICLMFLRHFDLLLVLGLNEPASFFWPTSVIVVTVGARLLVAGISMGSEWFAHLFERLFKQFGILTVVFAIVLSGILLINQAIEIGQHDAQEMLRRKPNANVIFAESSSAKSNFCSSNECDYSSEVYPFVVVHTSENFLYICQNCLDISTGRSSVHAVPIGDVDRITYSAIIDVKK